MPRKPSLRWNETQLSWYHRRSGFSREHWWVEATPNPELELARLLYSGKKRGRTLVPLLEPLMEKDLRRSEDAGFAAHLVKPVRIDELRRVLATLTGEA